ncbi:MAG: hypothetical protein ABI239_10700 [Aquihabitans sp.]
MSERINHGRRPLAFGAAALVAAAAFLIASAGPVAAGRPLEFTVTPATVAAGDPVAATSDVPCFNYETDLTVEVWVVTDSADPSEVYSTTGTLDDDFNWTASIDTSALPPGDYIVSARCQYDDDERWNNYQSEPLTVTAAVETTTSSMVDETTSTTETPGTTAVPTPEQPAAAPAAAVAGSPNYTG